MALKAETESTVTSKTKDPLAPLKPLKPKYIIIGRREGKYYAHHNKVSGALYVYYDINVADRKAGELEAKDKKLCCKIVPLKDFTE